MKCHCGILYEGSDRMRHPVYADIYNARSWWELEPEAFDELRVLIATPGIPKTLISDQLGKSYEFLRTVPIDLNELKHRAIENMSSITREDALRLVAMGKPGAKGAVGKHGSAYPLIAKIHAVTEWRNGRPASEVEREWGIVLLRRIAKDLARQGLPKVEDMVKNQRPTFPYSLYQWSYINPRLKSEFPHLIPDECPWLVEKRRREAAQKS